MKKREAFNSLFQSIKKSKYLQNSSGALFQAHLTQSHKHTLLIQLNSEKPVRPGLGFFLSITENLLAPPQHKSKLLTKTCSQVSVSHAFLFSCD